MKNLRHTKEIFFLAVVMGAIGLYLWSRPLTDEQTLQIARDTVSHVFKYDGGPDCIFFAPYKEGIYIIYSVTKVLNKNCPGNARTVSHIRDIRVDIKTGQVWYRSSKGDFYLIDEPGADLTTD